MSFITEGATPIIEKLEEEIYSLKDQLQRSIKNEEQYKAALAEAKKDLKDWENDCNQDQQYIQQLQIELAQTKENFMQYQSEAQQMFDVENSKLKKALEAAKQTLALIAEGEGSDESVYMAMGKAALAKIEELEKK